MNNFYASVECLYRPEIRDFPVAVAGDPLNRHGIILAKNMLGKWGEVLSLFDDNNKIIQQENLAHTIHPVSYFR